MKVDNRLMLSSFTRTLRLKVRRESYGWLNAAAVEVNQTFNFCNEASWLAAVRTACERQRLRTQAATGAGHTGAGHTGQVAPVSDPPYRPPHRTARSLPQ